MTSVSERPKTMRGVTSCNDSDETWVDNSMERDYVSRVLAHSVHGYTGSTESSDTLSVGWEEDELNKSSFQHKNGNEHKNFDGWLNTWP
jgi:hypothetical protein